MTFQLRVTPDVDAAIELLQAAEPTDAPYWGCFSGGKDSVVIKELARLAGVNVEWHYSVTTIDPPELIRFMSQHHKDVIRDRPKKYRNIAEMVAKRGFPTRQRRSCCRLFKESSSPPGRTLIMGVRAAESPARAKRWSEISYYKPSKSDVICPIVYWHDEDVWHFMREHNLPYCELYDQGYKRLGCVGCPMAGSASMLRDFERWPFAKRLWLKGFRDLWANKPDDWTYKTTYGSPEALFDWWLSDEGLPKDCDMALFAGGNE